MSGNFDWWPPDGPWPSTPGGLRGPDGRTLTDLYDQLASTNSHLSTLASAIALMASDLLATRQAVELLAGSPLAAPAGWQGLPSGLAGLADQLDLLRDQAAGIRSDTAQLPAMAGALEQLELVLGSVAHPPTGSTIKDLLRSIDAGTQDLIECCEGSGEEPPPPPPENDPPEGWGCGTMVRAVDWVRSDVTHDDPFGHGETRLWWPVFPLAAYGDSEVLDVPVASNGVRVPGLSIPGLRARVCISWDFSGGPQPIWFGRSIENTAEGAASTTLRDAPTLGGGATMTVGGLSDEISTCSGTPSQRWVGYAFWFPIGVEDPPLNVFAGFVDLTCVG